MVLIKSKVQVQLKKQTKQGNTRLQLKVFFCSALILLLCRNAFISHRRRDSNDWVELLAVRRMWNVRSQSGQKELLKKKKEVSEEDESSVAVCKLQHPPVLRRLFYSSGHSR